jgi:hypothetical protein
VFWSALFLVVGILFGIQQETARATVAVATGADRRPLRSSLAAYASFAAVVVLVVVGISGIWWGPASLGADHAGLVVQVALGGALNCVVAAISGVLAGSQLWKQLGLLISTDGIIRVVLVLIVLLVGGDQGWLSWAVILPFPLSLAIAFATAPRRIKAAARTPLGAGEFFRNSGQTMLAATATALLINGFPLLLSLASASSSSAALGALILAITLTRAPILVPLMALQSYLITRFAVAPERVRMTLIFLLGAILVAMILLAAVTWLWGSALLGIFFGHDFALAPAVLVPLVTSSGFIGALCVTGPAVLARNRHGAYTLGWLAASIVAIAVLLLPLPLDLRAIFALSVGPVAGIIVHLGALTRKPQVSKAGVERL